MISPLGKENLQHPLSILTTSEHCEGTFWRATPTCVSGGDFSAVQARVYYAAKNQIALEDILDCKKPCTTRQSESHTVVSLPPALLEK